MADMDHEKMRKHMEAAIADLPPGTTMLMIAYNSGTGQVGLLAPLSDRPLCLYMLEMAKTTIMDKPLASVSDLVIPGVVGVIPHA